MKTGSISDFQTQVYNVVKRIPQGKVATYGQIAGVLGKPKAARAVGQALRKNPTPISVPCHRVVSSCGSLGGYSGGLEKKIKLLAGEGIRIKDGKIELEKYGWKL